MLHFFGGGCDSIALSMSMSGLTRLLRRRNRFFVLFALEDHTDEYRLVSFILDVKGEVPSTAFDSIRFDSIRLEPFD